MALRFLLFWAVDAVSLIVAAAALPGMALVAQPGLSDAFMLHPGEVEETPTRTSEDFFGILDARRACRAGSRNVGYSSAGWS
jgi:hypothetical protein